MGRGVVSSLEAMLSGMDPVLAKAAWCFLAISDPDAVPGNAFAVIREEEGACCIIPATAAPADAPQFARITLRVNSDLEGVGLTAAVSSALAGAGIACNIVAGLHHDHMFVPWDRRDEALALLEKLSRDANR